MTATIFCNVLVVDDDEAAAAKIGLYLLKLNGCRDLTNLGLELTVTLSTSATWALDEVCREPGRWQVVLSDVMMPADDPGVQAKQEKLAGFDLWKRPRGTATLPTFQDGGFGSLAAPLAEARAEQPQKPWPKFVLTSARLEDPDRHTVDEFRREHGAWFKYYDKLECWGGNERLYHFALLQAVSTYTAKSWDDEGFYPACIAWERLQLEAKELARRSDLRHVLIVGPSGSGKAHLAEYLFHLRGITDARKLDAAELDVEKAALEAHHKSSAGGLYISRPNMTSLAAHGAVNRQIRLDEVEPGDGHRLCIWSVESIETLQRSEFLAGPLLSEFEDMQRIEVPALTTNNIENHARDLIRRFWPTFKLGDEALQVLKNTSWPNHLSSLRAALKQAVRQASDDSQTTLVASHLSAQRLVSMNAKDAKNHVPKKEDVTTPDRVVAEMRHATPSAEDIKQIAAELKVLSKVPATKDWSKPFSAAYVLAHPARFDKLLPFAAADEDQFDSVLKDQCERRVLPNNNIRFPRYDNAAISLLTRGKVTTKQTLQKMQTSHPTSGGRKPMGKRSRLA